ncbi:18857_t:CDS:2 [Racocetra persica]|uniref:18857_t:CDS:1 n=1 Tax=Racocetra persica TaxID=160502 RepID=A0ACA9K8C6_9GLOM|nr:18857_t:CDS:2 [Racocetra persica]
MKIHVDEEELPRLLNIEKSLIMIDKIIKPLLDDSSFGGTYIIASRKAIHKFFAI